MSEVEFETALREQLAASPEGETTDEPVPAPEEGTTEPEPVTTEEQPEAKPELIGGKFKSWEDVLRAHQEAESHLTRLAQENAELRRYAEEAQTPRPGPSDAQHFDRMLEQDPRQALALALGENDGLRSKQALDAWYEDDPVGATDYIVAARVGVAQQQMQQTLTPQIEPLTQAYQTQQYAQSIAQLRGRHPDADDAFVGAMLDVVQERPHLTYALLYGDDGSRDQLLEDLYTLTRAARPVQETQPQAQEAPKPPKARTEPPHVVSPGRGSTEGEPSLQDQLKEIFLGPKEDSLEVARGIRTE